MPSPPIAVLLLILAWAGLAGCRSAPGLASRKPDQAGRNVKPVNYAGEITGPAVTLEPEDGETDGAPSGWRRLLHPFNSKKERLPLPLSKKPVRAGDDPSFDGF